MGEKKETIITTTSLVQSVKDFLQKEEESNFDKGLLHLIDYSGVKRFKSIRRAIRRGHVSVHGSIYPNRPFKNVSTKDGRHSITKLKKSIYAQLTNRGY